MRGIIFTSLGISILTITALFITYAYSGVHEVYEVPYSYTKAMLSASYGFLEWEVKGKIAPPSPATPESKCFPALLLDSLGDPGEELADPFVIYYCEVG